MVGKILKKLDILLDRKQKLQMLGLVFLMLIGAALNVLGVSLIVPVVNIVMDPNAVTDNEILHWIYVKLHATSQTQISVLVMVSLVLVFILKNLFLFFQTKALFAFVYTNQFRSSQSMMKNYIRRPYEFFLNADTAVVQRSITSDVNNMYALILALLQLASDIIIFLFLVAYCLLQDVAMTILLATVMVVLLLLIKMVLKMVTNMIDTVQDIRLKNQPLVLMMQILQDENEKIRLLFEKMNNKSLNKLNKDWFYTNPYFTVKKLINK